MTTKPDEVILHVEVANEETLTYEIVLPDEEYQYLLACRVDSVGDRLFDAVRDGEGEIIDSEQTDWEVADWEVVDEKYKPTPRPFQVNRDKIIADLRASNGPTAEQVDTVEKLLDAVPEGWYEKLPLPSWGTWTSDDDGSIGPMLQFASGRARLTVCVGEDIFVEQRSDNADDDIEFGLDEGTWLDKWLNCLRWFIGESLEV